jgi:hypothetical protein
LPQVSSSTAIVTGPIWVGSIVNRLEPFGFGRDVVDRERGARDAVADQRRLVGPGRGMGVGLEQQLGAVRIVGRHHRQPAVLPEGNVVLDDESEHIGVEALGLRLVVDEDAGDAYSHRGSSADRE